jgi:hypothetical protein
MAVWALGELLEEGELAALAAENMARETDEDVRSEWLALSA